MLTLVPSLPFVPFTPLDTRVKAISVNGVAPTDETIKDGTYQIQRPFVLVTKTDGKLSETAQEFFDFCFSEDAKGIIESAGVVPAN